MAVRLHTLHADRVFCPTTGAAVPIRLVEPDDGALPDAGGESEARMVCLGFTDGVCRGRCSLTGEAASVMGVRAREEGPDCVGPARRARLALEP